MHIEAFIILLGLFLAVASLVRIREESAAGRRGRRTSRRTAGGKAQSRRKVVGAAAGR